MACEVEKQLGMRHDHFSTGGANNGGRCEVKQVYTCCKFFDFR